MAPQFQLLPGVLHYFITATYWILGVSLRWSSPATCGPGAIRVSGRISLLFYISDTLYPVCWEIGARDTSRDAPRRGKGRYWDGCRRAIHVPLSAVQIIHNCSPHEHSSDENRIKRRKQEKNDILDDGMSVSPPSCHYTPPLLHHLAPPALHTFLQREREYFLHAPAHLR
ncbi:hypothetical protein A0H81_04682 [Grifola frondosa]|uniref:Uncharacterized protein n=1 Tax=Grifola frondosa TaxID=5627 RepID=A0A1C7MG23_GRIFR|nr:hypothetical protein A0H81_04682 [Grifola frondosa]